MARPSVLWDKPRWNMTTTTTSDVVECLLSAFETINLNEQRKLCLSVNFMGPGNAKHTVQLSRLYVRGVNCMRVQFDSVAIDCRTPTAAASIAASFVLRESAQHVRLSIQHEDLTIWTTPVQNSADVSAMPFYERVLVHALAPSRPELVDAVVQALDLMGAVVNVQTAAKQ